MVLALTRLIPFGCLYRWGGGASSRLSCDWYRHHLGLSLILVDVVVQVGPAPVRPVFDECCYATEDSQTKATEGGHLVIREVS